MIDDHHQLLEDTEPMSSIESPCCCFTQMDEMPGACLLSDSQNAMFGTWKDLLESIIIHLWNAVSKEAKLLKGLL